MPLHISSKLDSKCFKAFENVDKESNLIFMSMESFADSLNLKLLPDVVSYYV